MVRDKDKEDFGGERRLYRRRETDEWPAERDASTGEDNCDLNGGGIPQDKRKRRGRLTGKCRRSETEERSNDNRMVKETVF